MKNIKKVMIGIGILLVVMLIIHLSVNYMVPMIKEMHQGMVQY